MRLDKKGVYFIMDAIIGASILVLGLLLVSSHYVAEHDTTLLSYFGNNLIESLSELEVQEVKTPYVEALIQEGNITEENNTILEQIGEFWAREEYNLAFNFTQSIAETMIPNTYGVSIKVNDELVYERGKEQNKMKIAVQKLISGLDRGKPIRGFISRAWANRIIKETTQVVTLSPEGSGWDGTIGNPGWVNITKYFSVPNDANISSALAYISIHNENDAIADWTLLDINNGNCTYTMNNLYDNGALEEGLFVSRNVTNCIRNGSNQVSYILKNAGYNGHFHPGNMIVIDYSVEQSSSFPDTQVSERFYFDNVHSFRGDLDGGGSNDGSGAWALLPFYIPDGATNISASLHLNAVYDDYWDQRGDGDREVADVRIYVNDDDYFWRQTHASNDINDYDWAGVGAYNGGIGLAFDQMFNITDEVHTGTNVVSAYINCEGDQSWGWNQSLIYSDPVNDAGNSSYVEVNYTYVPRLVFGTVDITQTSEFGGAADRDKTGSFQFPSEATEIKDVFVNIAQQYSWRVRVMSDTVTPPPWASLAFESPSDRAVPTKVYVPDTYLDVSELATNYIRVRDENNGNDVLPNSTIEYTFLVNSRVGYGEVFFTEADAEADALQRLNDSVGTFVDLEDIQIDSNGIKDVPSMWGPAVIEVRIWQ